MLKKFFYIYSQCIYLFCLFTSLLLSVSCMTDVWCTVIEIFRYVAFMFVYIENEWQMSSNVKHVKLDWI